LMGNSTPLEVVDVLESVDITSKMNTTVITTL
jgi:hypothetical protein